MQQPAIEFKMMTVGTARHQNQSEPKEIGNMLHSKLLPYLKIDNSKSLSAYVFNEGSFFKASFK